jgi:tetratricopeptide (TPR) repeat protein
MHGDRVTSFSLLSRAFTGLCVVLALAASPGSFAGAPSFVDKVGSVGEVVLGGQVDVPLYQDPANARAPLVSAVVNGAADKPVAFFAVDSRTSLITVSDAFVTTYGLEKKTTNKKLINLKEIRLNRAATAEDYEASKYKVGGEITYVEIPSLKIGDLELKNVTALVNSSKASVGGVDKKTMVIGMGALPGVAWAVRPSVGKVSFAPAAQGTALLGLVKASPVPYSSVPWDVVKFGNKPGKRWRAHKVVAPARNAIVAGKVGGVEVSAALATAGGSTVALSKGVKSDLVQRQGDTAELWVPVDVAATSLGQTWVAVRGEYDMGNFPSHQANIGADLLAGYDIAVDPGTSQLALAPAGATVIRADVRPILLDAAVKAVAEADKKAAEAAQAEGKPAKPDAGALGKLAEVYRTQGMVAEMLATREKIAALDAKDCMAQFELGSAQLAAGKVNEAVTSLSASSALFHGWWDRPLDERKDLGKELDDAEEGVAVLDAAGKEVTRAAGSCQSADASLALAYVALKDYAKAEAVYRDNLDLDAGLARAWGTGALVAGQNAKATEAFRQALKRDQAPDRRSHLGLALATAASGDVVTAAGLFEKAFATDINDAVVGALWLDTLRGAQGPEASLAAAGAWMRSHPGSLVGAALYAREAKAVGNAAAGEQARRVGDGIVAFRRSTSGDLVLSDAAYALFLLYTGDVDGAAKAADAAVRAYGNTAGAWYAVAEVMAVKGVEARAAEARKKAALLGGTHPGYALLAR